MNLDEDLSASIGAESEKIFFRHKKRKSTRRLCRSSDLRYRVAMSIFHSASEMKKLVRRPKSHAEWNLLLLYAIPAIAILVGAVVFFIRLMSSLF
jgi:hypothetical protein